jgi:hypothetical protein
MDNKISLSRSDAFRMMSTKHFEKMDEKLIASMKDQKMLEDESEKESRERLLEAQFGAGDLQNVMKPRFVRSRGGKQFRLVQKLDGRHIDRDKENVGFFPVDPDQIDSEADYVNLLQNAVRHSESERNKYFVPNNPNKNLL